MHLKSETNMLRETETERQRDRKTERQGENTTPLRIRINVDETHKVQSNIPKQLTDVGFSCIRGRSFNTGLLSSLTLKSPKSHKSSGAYYLIILDILHVSSIKTTLLFKGWTLESLKTRFCSVGNKLEMLLSFCHSS